MVSSQVNGRRRRLRRIIDTKQRNVPKYRRKPRPGKTTSQLEYEAAEGWARLRAEQNSFGPKFKKWYTYFSAALATPILAVYAFLEQCAHVPEASQFLQDERVEPVFLPAVSAVFAAAMSAGTAVWTVMWVLVIGPGDVLPLEEFDGDAEMRLLTCLAAVLLLACTDSPTRVEEPRDRFDHTAIIAERPDDELLFLFNAGAYRYFQVQADTIGYWETGRYWLTCDHPVECSLTIGRTDGNSGEELEYYRLSPIFVGPDGVEIGGRAYAWLDFGEAEARIPESRGQ